MKIPLFTLCLLSVAAAFQPAANVRSPTVLFNWFGDDNEHAFYYRPRPQSSAPLDKKTYETIRHGTLPGPGIPAHASDDAYGGWDGGLPDDERASDALKPTPYIPMMVGVANQNAKKYGMRVGSDVAPDQKPEAWHRVY